MVKTELKKKRSLLQMDELKCRKRVLRRLAYCSASDVIEMKGRVACEIDRFESPTLHFLLYRMSLPYPSLVFYDMSCDVGG